jgi:hypothetical protein
MSAPQTRPEGSHVLVLKHGLGGSDSPWMRRSVDATLRGSDAPW